jgi:hypothetical protein
MDQLPSIALGSRAEDGDDVGYDYGAAKVFLYIQGLSQPPNLPTRADDSGDMCYEFFKILTKEILAPGSLARAQSRRVDYKRVKMLYSKHPDVISKKKALQPGRQTAVRARV